MNVEIIHRNIAFGMWLIQGMVNGFILAVILLVKPAEPIDMHIMEIVGAVGIVMAANISTYFASHNVADG